jgi:hypothetical protein
LEGDFFEDVNLTLSTAESFLVDCFEVDGEDDLLDEEVADVFFIGEMEGPTVGIFFDDDDAAADVREEAAGAAVAAAVVLFGGAVGLAAMFHNLYFMSMFACHRLLSDLVSDFKKCCA